MTRTVVSVSPLRLDRDSRSHRAALSFRRFGYRVVAVEGEASAVEANAPPFPVISLRGPAGQGGGAAAETPLLKRFMPGILWECGAFAWFVLQVFAVDVAKGLLRVPRADLYYLHEYRLFPMVYALAKISGAKILYDAHDFYPGVHADVDLTPFWRRVFRPFLVWLERLCIDHVAGMVTVNAGIAQLYKETFGIAAAAVTRNCHEPAMDVAVPQGIRERLALPADAFLLVTIGNCKPGQDVAAGLEAMAGLPADVHLAFLGRGYDGYRPRIVELGLQGRIHLPGPVGAGQVVPMIRSASAALILYYARSKNDAHFMPNGFFQAIAAGLPVLYPDLRWIRDLAERHGIGVKIDARDPRSIQQGVAALRARMTADPAGLAANLKRAARENSWQGEEAVLKGLLARTLDA